MHCPMKTGCWYGRNLPRRLDDILNLSDEIQEELVGWASNQFKVMVNIFELNNVYNAEIKHPQNWRTASPSAGLTTRVREWAGCILAWNCRI
jgi:hypothetical protein